MNKFKGSKGSAAQVLLMIRALVLSSRENHQENLIFDGYKTTVGLFFLRSFMITVKSNVTSILSDFDYIRWVYLLIHNPAAA